MKKIIFIWLITISLFGQVERRQTISNSDDVMKVLTDSLLISKTDSSLLVNGSIEIGVDSTIAPLIVTPLEVTPTNWRGLEINSPVDDNLWEAIVIRAGLSSTQRRYISWENHLGVRTNLFGCNASNDFILFDAIDTLHFMTFDPEADSYLNSNGATGRVVVNYYNGEVHGSGGLFVANGAGVTLTKPGLYGAIHSLGVEAYGGTAVRSYNPNNTDYLEMNTGSTSNNYFNSTLPMKFKTSGANIEFYNASFNSLFKIMTSTGNVGIGLPGTPTSKLQVVGLPIYADNASAVSGGLTVGAFYRTGGDPDLVCVVH